MRPTACQRQPSAVDLRHRAIRESINNPTISVYKFIDGAEVRRPYVIPMVRMQAAINSICDTLSSIMGMPDIGLNGWDSLKAANMPPCPRCGQPIRPGQWIDHNGAHLTCRWTAP